MWEQASMWGQNRDRATGRGIRVLAVVDLFTRECLALEVDTSPASRRVTRCLEHIIEQRGMPEAIRCDNGPQLTRRHFLNSCEERTIQLVTSGRDDRCKTNMWRLSTAV